MTSKNIMLKIHSIESFGAHDGPGIRMVLFLQGCNIKCLYCQNADTIPTTGGTEYSISDIVKRAVNLKGYFGTEGGVTVSGGEPLLQSEAIVELFKQLKQEGINTNIDTNGTVINQYSRVLISDISDLVMFDIKHITPNGFEKLVGKQLHKQAFELIKLREDSGKPFWFRYVLVPGYTDNVEYLEQIGEYFKDYKNITRFQILPYHNLGKYKWEKLGEKYQLDDVLENTPEQIHAAKVVLERYFGNLIC